LLAFVLLSAIPLALATFYEPLAWGAVAIWAAAIVLALIDARATRPLTADDVSRQITEQPSLRAADPVRLTVRNPLARRLALTIRDEPPASFDVDRRSVRVEVGGRASASAEYAARPRHRGTFQFGDLHTRQPGPLGLMERRAAWTPPWR